MTTELGLMGAELSNVHFRRTSVPLTASTLPCVYIRIPLTCSMPATSRQQSLLQKEERRAHRADLIIDIMAGERKIHIHTQKYNIRDMNSASSVNSCLVSACSVPGDPASAYAVLLQEKSLTPSCHRSRVKYILKSHIVVHIPNVRD